MSDMDGEQPSLFEDVVELDDKWRSALTPVVYKCDECRKPISQREARVSGLGAACAAKLGRKVYQTIREHPQG